MIKLKKELLKKVPLVLGCSLFFLSVIFPFYYENPPIVIEDRLSFHYWSFKSSMYVFAHLESYLLGKPDAVIDYWFYDYWFSYSNLESSWLLIFMFVVQVITSVVGITSIFLDKKFLAFMLALVCPISTLLMIQVRSNHYSWGSFQLGFWLTYPSIALFAFNAVIEAKFVKKAN
jgi:hypothetical protein